MMQSTSKGRLVCFILTLQWDNLCRRDLICRTASLRLCFSGGGTDLPSGWAANPSTKPGPLEKKREGLLKTPPRGEKGLSLTLYQPSPEAVFGILLQYPVCSVDHVLFGRIDLLVVPVIVDDVGHAAFVLWRVELGLEVFVVSRLQVLLGRLLEPLVERAGDLFPSKVGSEAQCYNKMILICSPSSVHFGLC